MVDLFCFGLEKQLISFLIGIVSSFQDFTKVMGFLSSCSHMDYRERKKSAGFENTLGNLSSVWDSSSFLVASWSKCDCSLSSYSFESICCNLRLILHSHENDPCFSLLIYTQFYRTKKNHLARWKYQILSLPSMHVGMPNLRTTCLKLVGNSKNRKSIKYQKVP